MNLYIPKQLADSMRVVRKNTIAIAEDISEAQYDYRPTQGCGRFQEMTHPLLSKMTHSLCK